MSVTRGVIPAGTVGQRGRMKDIINVLLSVLGSALVLKTETADVLEYGIFGSDVFGIKIRASGYYNVEIGNCIIGVGAQYTSNIAYYDPLPYTIILKNNICAYTFGVGGGSIIIKYNGSEIYASASSGPDIRMTPTGAVLTSLYNGQGKFEKYAEGGEIIFTPAYPLAYVGGFFEKAPLPGLYLWSGVASVPANTIFNAGGHTFYALGRYLALLI